MTLSIKGTGTVIFVLIALSGCITDSNDPLFVMSKIRKAFLQQANEKQYYRNAYYTEKAKVDNHIVAYSEGYGHLISLGDNFMIPVDNYCLLLDNIRKADSKKSWKDFLVNLYKQTKVSKQSDICPSYNALLTSYRWFEINGPVSKKNKGRYDYKLINTNNNLNKKVIHFSPKDTLQKYLYQGMITFDLEMNQLKNIRLDSCRFYSEPFRKWVIATLFINFIYLDEKVYFSGLDAFYTIGKLQHWIDIKTTDTTVNTILLSNNECVHLSMNDNNPLVLYDEYEWGKFSMRDNEDFTEIKRDLEFDNISLTDQFRRNSGNFFYTMITSGKTDNVDYELLKLVKAKLK